MPNVTLRIVKLWLFMENEHMLHVYYFGKTTPPILIKSILIYVLNFDNELTHYIFHTYILSARGPINSKKKVGNACC